MPPKKWGTAVNKSYAKGNAPSVIADELTRDTQSASARPSPAPTPAASVSAARPNAITAAQQLQDPRNRMLMESEVKANIRKKITDNNLLGLPPTEIDSMVELLLAAKSKQEVFEWCGTLMLEEKAAVEIISMRETNRVGLFSDGSSTPAAAATPTGKKEEEVALPSLQSAKGSNQAKKSESGGPKILAVNAKGATSTANAVPLNNTSDQPVVGSGTKKRGANSKALANINTLGSNSIVIGKFFECGCFAATHNFISNCLNCGRIFCEQEMPAKAAEVGSYAARAGGMTTESIMCYACGQDPNKNITFEIKVQQGLVDSLAANKAAKGYEEAVERRNQLLQFARERSKRTTVVDDQGVGGLVYGSNTAWMTEEEVEAMEEKDRKARIAEMHKHTGAYRIHLDIVNQSVCLGAIPSTEKAPEVENVWSSGANAAVGTDGSGAVIPNAKALGAADEDNNNSDGGDEAYDSEDEGARRILPLPTLLQKLWYNAEENSKSGGAGSNWDSGARMINESSSGPTGTNSTLAVEGPTVLDLKPTTHRGLIASKRVQNDYFEDDDMAYRVEREDFIFKTKRALIDEDEAIKKGLKPAGGGAGKKGVNGYSSPPPSSGPQVDMKSFSKHGVVEDTSASDIGSSNAIGAAMAAGGRTGDQGMCMSLHQPWASLCVAGIKIHEGRSWNSDFKGRLWIHAAAAQYTENEIEAIEEQHRQFLRANGIEKDKKFPTNYPTSCLLGYINVTEVISKEEYNTRIPDPEKRLSIGEEGFVFMCEKGAKMLPFPLPMEGKHKIYKLDRKIWGSARKQFGEE